MNSILIAVLTDFSSILAMVLTGFTGGWLACSIITSGKIRRLQHEVWRQSQALYARRLADLKSKHP